MSYNSLLFKQYFSDVEIRKDTKKGVRYDTYCMSFLVRLDQSQLPTKIQQLLSFVLFG